MGIQDNTEQVLRKLHILLSQSEVYDEAAGTVIVDKKAIIAILQELNVCIYGMMEEYEITQQGKDKAERDTRKVGEEIIRDARHTAEDVYAASVMYTDEALRRAMDIVDETMKSLKGTFLQMEKDLQSKKTAIANNKLELKSQLQDLKDTDKYLQLIEERNKQIEKEKNEEQEEEVSPTAHIKPEIKINMDYFAQNGIPIEPDMLPQGQEKAAPSQPSEIRKETRPSQPSEIRKETRASQSSAYAGKEVSTRPSGYEEKLDVEMLELEEILKAGMNEENREAETSGGKIVDVASLADKIAAQTVADLGKEEFATESTLPLAAGSESEEVYDYGEEPEIKVTPEIRVNLDAEYFKWKDNTKIEDFGDVDVAVTPGKAKKNSRFGRKK